MNKKTPRKYRTQGIKGARAPRINMAFDPDVHTFIREQAQQKGETMTRVVNEVLREKMEEETT